MIYLCSPYSHQSVHVMQWRFEEVCRIASHLMRIDHRIYSPIAASHPLAIHGGLPTHWEFWRQYDIEMIRACEAVWVVTMDGWRESKGVQAEILIAAELGKPVRYIDPHTLAMVEAA